MSQCSHDLEVDNKVGKNDRVILKLKDRSRTSRVQIPKTSPPQFPDLGSPRPPRLAGQRRGRLQTIRTTPAQVGPDPEERSRHRKRVPYRGPFPRVEVSVSWPSPPPFLELVSPRPPRLAGHRRCGEQTRHSLGSGGSRPGKWVPTQQQGNRRSAPVEMKPGKRKGKKKYFTKYIKTSIVAVTFNPASNGVPMATSTKMHQNLQRGPPTGWMLPQIGFGT